MVADVHFLRPRLLTHANLSYCQEMIANVLMAWCNGPKMIG